MIIWNRYLRISSKLEDRNKQHIFGKRIDYIDKVKEKISSGKSVLGVYCICSASNPGNLLDIISAAELHRSHYRNSKINILGLACDKEDAEEMSAAIIKDVYIHTGGFNIRDYYQMESKDTMSSADAADCMD